MRELDAACPPGAFASITSTSSPSDAAYTAAASPDGPAPMTTTSRMRVSSMAWLNPRHSAISSFVGSRRTALLPQITTGMSAAPTLNRSSSSCTPASRSRSTYVYGCPLRERNSFTRSVPGE